jgi:cell division protein FtsZ
VGVGGAGTNAINHMIEAGVAGVEFLVMNTDAQALGTARTPNRLRLGETLTRGLGAGGNPAIGRRAAEESYAAICEALAGADMVFITAGMGGGTGTGASPLVAQAAREGGALTVAVVTTPFAFERRRKLVAEQGVEAVREMVDALIVVPNERLMQLAGSDMGAFAAYRMADDVLRQAIQGISDLITIPGLINLDFADIEVVMDNAGSALMSIGQANGENRAEEAARKAITNPLLEVDISGARGVVFNITAGDDLTMREVDTIAEVISGAAHPDANIIFGTVYDPGMAGSLKITVVATGFEPRVTYDRQRPLRARAHSPIAGSGAGAGTDTGTAIGKGTEPGMGNAASNAAPATSGQLRAVPPGQPPQQPQPGLHVRPAMPPSRIGYPIAPSERPRQADSAASSANSGGQEGSMPQIAGAGDGAWRRASGDGDPGRQSRRISALRPGYHGDEFLSNDEPEEAQVPPASRSRWDQLFGRR